MIMHKGEIKREQQSRMKWFLNFLNTDISSLNSVELLKLFLDFGVFIYGHLYFEEVEKMHFKPEKGLIQEKRFLNVCQDYLRSLLDSLVTFQEFDGIGIQNPGFDMMIVSYCVGITDDKIFKFPLVPRLLLLVSNLPKYLDEDGEKGDLYRGILLDAYFMTLSPFHLSRIKICQKPDCGKYFYQKTIRTKGDFCSPRCKNWAATKRWRKNHNEEWKVYMRDYQRERREKARQDQIEIKCPSCGFRESKGLLGDYLNHHLDEEDCPQCKKAKLLHIIKRWDKSERSWIPEEYAFIEWKNYLKGIKKGEG